MYHHIPAIIRLVFGLTRLSLSTGYHPQYRILMSKTYTGSYTDTGGVELQFPVSSDFSNYTFSCKLNETVASRTIKLLAGTYVCMNGL